MAEFVAFEPQVEVLGQSMLSALAGMGEEATVYLAHYDLGDIQPEEWYRNQDWLDFFKAVSSKESNAMFDLVSIGMKIPENAMFPPQIDSISSALLSTDVAYHMNHRNGEIGHYTATVTGENSIDMVCKNPYPCLFDYGLIYGLVRRFRPENVRFVVQHDDDAPCRQKGADSCTYHISWG